MIMMYPTFARRNSWLPTVFNDFFDTDFMPKANATAPAIQGLYRGTGCSGHEEGELRREHQP